MKKILLLYLLIITISLKNAVEFGKEITFSRNNNNLFEFTFNQYGFLFVQIDFPKNNLLELKVESKYFEQLIQVTKPGISAVIPFDLNIPVKIILSYINPSDEKGIIWMNPSTVEIKVDLNKKYEWKYDFSGEINRFSHHELIYSIDKAEKDMILQFKYNENIYIPSYYSGYIPTDNPLKICHLEKCNINILTYKIHRGESYKIYISNQEFLYANNSIYYLPSFSIQFIEPKGIKPEFGKEISFDIDNNNKFESNFSEDGSLFIRVDFNISNLLDIIISSSIDNYSTTIQPPGLQTVIPFKKEKNIEIYLKYKSASNEKGKIWMYLSTQEIKVNLNQTYEFKYDFKRTCGHQITSNLIYSIDNAEYNALLQFKYNNKLIIDKNMNAGNPMKILDGKEYKTNITSYIINKGNSYKIYINTKFFVLNKNKIEYIHYLPYFSFNFII